MSSTEETTAEEEAAAAADVMCCASCGVAAIDDVELKKKCACGLVKYCSDDCQNNHREQHKDSCTRRLAEIRDRDLFEQPDESYMGDCPICCLPLSLDQAKSGFMGCCSKTICNGCNHANQKREFEAGLEQRCAFCREPMPETGEESHKRIMERVKKNCPAAMYHMGKERCLEGDHGSAFKYWTKAAALGDAGAHYNLSILYRDGEGYGVEKDIKKYIYHSEQAAIAGHHMARHNLGYIEAMDGRYERARKHWIIAANLGHHDSLKCLRIFYAKGHASKEDYANSLRAYQAAVEATKSAQREEAEAYYEAMDAAQQS